jgi:IS1 family transposase
MAEAQPELLAQERDEIVTELRARLADPKVVAGPPGPEPQWLWYVIDHRSGHVLAHVFGRRKDAGFLKCKALLEPFGITRYYSRALRVHTHVISR